MTWRGRESRLARRLGAYVGSVRRLKIHWYRLCGDRRQRAKTRTRRTRRLGAASSRSEGNSPRATSFPNLRKPVTSRLCSSSSSGRPTSGQIQFPWTFPTLLTLHEPFFPVSSHYHRSDTRRPCAWPVRSSPYFDPFPPPGFLESEYPLPPVIRSLSAGIITLSTYTNP